MSEESKVPKAPYDHPARSIATEADAGSDPR